MNAVAQRSIVAEQSSTIVALVSTIAAQDSGITAQGSYLVELANRLEAFNASLQSNGTMCPGVEISGTNADVYGACCRLLSLAVACCLSPFSDPGPHYISSYAALTISVLRVVSFAHRRHQPSSCGRPKALI